MTFRLEINRLSLSADTLRMIQSAFNDPAAAARQSPVRAEERELSRTAHGLSAEQLETIALAQRHARPIMRAASVAAFSGWTSAVLAGLTLLTGFGSVSAMAVGAALGVVGMIELRGGKGLRRFDAKAPRRLALNQLALFTILFLYCGFSIITTVKGPNPYDEYMSAGADVANAIRPIARLHTTVTVAFYGLVIVGSAAAQGCGAIYYLTRARRLTDFMAATPPWAVQALQAAAG